jgi:hypothetical protein
MTGVSLKIIKILIDYLLPSEINGSIDMFYLAAFLAFTRKLSASGLGLDNSNNVTFFILFYSN